MSELVVFQPANAWLIQYMQEKLAPVFPEVKIGDTWPTPGSAAPKNFIVLNDAGGIRLSIVSQQQTVSVTVVAESCAKADRITAYVNALLAAIDPLENNPVCVVEDVGVPATVADSVYSHVKHFYAELIVTGQVTKPI